MRKKNSEKRRRRINLDLFFSLKDIESDDGWGESGETATAETVRNCRSGRRSKRVDQNFQVLKWSRVAILYLYIYIYIFFLRNIIFIFIFIYWSWMMSLSDKELLSWPRFRLPLVQFNLKRIQTACNIILSWRHEIP